MYSIVKSVLIQGGYDLTAIIKKYVVGKWYYNGDKCSFEGVNYVCIAPEGATCVWSPKDYPAYWEVAE